MGRVSIVLFTTGPGALWWLFDVEVFEILFIERLQANGPLRTIACLLRGRGLTN